MAWDLIKNEKVEDEVDDVSILHQRLQRVEHTLSNLFLAISESSIISRTDKKGNIIFVNENFSKISGYAIEELIGKPHNIINSGYHPPVFWKNVWKQIGKGKIWRGEVCNRAKNGQLYWVDTFIYPYFDEKGKLVEYFSIRNDITARKAHEQALSRSQNLLRAIFDSSREVYFLLSPQKRLLAFNSEAERLFRGGPSVEVSLQRFLKLQEGFEKRFERSLNGNVIEVEREVTLLDQTKRWFSVKYLPAYDHDGGIVGVSINLADIHERKLQELELVRQNEALMKIGWLQSHEIRRPVASILGLVQLLEKEPVFEQNPLLINHLKKMTQELDDKTREIVKLTI